MIPNYHFGISLRKYLDKHGIKQAHICDKIGVTTATFNSYFKAKNPREETQKRLLDALGITVEILYDECKEAKEATERERELQKQVDELRSELMIYQKKEINELRHQVLVGAIQP